MPRSHQEHAKWTPERITTWIHKIGEATAKLAEGIINRRAHPQARLQGLPTLGHPGQKTWLGASGGRLPEGLPLQERRAHHRQGTGQSAFADAGPGIQSHP
ncbi:hypothetical protein DFAR_2210051 [Desulfarculales bacterium]